MDLNKTCVELDLETFGTRPNSVIISIGAVKFNCDGISDRFHINVNPRDGVDLGLVINQDTLAWWKKQPPGVLKQSMSNAVPLREGIEKFVDWYGKKSMQTFSKGSAFDFSILAMNFDLLGIPDPWKYWDVKDHRTIVKLLDPDDSFLPKASGDLHNALVDAELQAMHLINIWKNLND